MNKPPTVKKTGVSWLLTCDNIPQTLSGMEAGMTARALAMKIVDMLNQPQKHKIPKTFRRVEFIKNIYDNLPKTNDNKRLTFKRFGHELVIAEKTESNQKKGQPNWSTFSPKEDFLLSIIERIKPRNIISKHYEDGPELLKFLWLAVPNKTSKSIEELCKSGKSIQEGGIIPTKETDTYGVRLVEACPEITTPAFLLACHRFLAWDTFRKGWEILNIQSPDQASKVSNRILCYNLKPIQGMPEEFYEGAAQEFKRNPPDLAAPKCVAAIHLFPRNKSTLSELLEYKKELLNEPDILAAKFSRPAEPHTKRERLILAHIQLAIEKHNLVRSEETTEIEMF